MDELADYQETRDLILRQPSREDVRKRLAGYPGEVMMLDPGVLDPMLLAVRGRLDADLGERKGGTAAKGKTRIDPMRASNKMTVPASPQPAVGRTVRMFKVVPSPTARRAGITPRMITSVPDLPAGAPAGENMRSRHTGATIPPERSVELSELQKELSEDDELPEDDELSGPSEGGEAMTHRDAMQHAVSGELTGSTMALLQAMMNDTSGSTAIEKFVELVGQFRFSFKKALAVLTEIYRMIERSFESYFDVFRFEPFWPRPMTLEKKREIFRFTAFPRNADGGLVSFPPHLESIPPKENVAMYYIFDLMGLIETQGFLREFYPKGLVAKGLWYAVKRYNGDVSALADQEPNMRAIEAYNRSHGKRGTDIEGGSNIGMLEDWYTDRRFADQALSGVDPTTIERAPADLLEEFVEAAREGGYEHWAAELPRIPREELFVEDCRWFREAVGAGPREELKNGETEGQTNWACASVTLYRLQDNGRLHPVAIVIDYRGSMRDSVTIFNRAAEAAAPDVKARRVPEQEADWPWRYAKMCAQSSSWVRHEVGTHLTLSHFVEEAIIVATHRWVPEDHIIFRVLQPHWYKTLSLNAAARGSLVPDVVQPIVGLAEDQLHAFIRHSFTSFDFTAGYVPNDLRRRGFPDTTEGLAGERYRDCAYAKNALGMWHAIRRYVRAMLLTQYDERDADAQVAADEHIPNWVREIRGPAHIPSFPSSITTLDALVDAVTMCIHIAAPFHTAVNYLQNFYLAFVPSRPPSLSSAPPATLADLRAYTEADVVAALPMRRTRQWLLSVQVPWLLSFKVNAHYSLMTFAASQRAVNHGSVRAASQQLEDHLRQLATDVVDISEGMNEGSIPYKVLNPGTTAVSILI